MRLSGILGSEPFECIVERDQIAAAIIGSHLDVLERHTNGRRPAAALGAAAARDVHENPPHHLRGHPEEVSAVLPANLIPPEQPKAHLVDERRWLQRQMCVLAGQIAQRHAVQLVVNDREQPVERTRIAIAPGTEQRRQIVVPGGGEGVHRGACPGSVYRRDGGRRSTRRSQLLFPKARRLEESCNRLLKGEAADFRRRLRLIGRRTHIMNKDASGIGRVMAAALAIAVALSGEARAQCTTQLTAGLRMPLGIALSNQGNLLVSETGTTGALHSGRISIIDTDGVRRTLLDGLPSATNDVNESSGPAGLFMRGRTLYVVIGIGDAILVPAPNSPVRVGNPSPAAPIFSSVLAIHFSAHVENTTAGFAMTTTDHDALAAGRTVTLSNGGGGAITIELVADFPDYVPSPFPTAPENVQGSNPFDVELIGNHLYVTDGGRNLLWKANVHTGAAVPLAAFGTIPNPTPIGAPVLDAVPTGIREFKGQLFVTLFRGFPFAPLTSSVEQIDPDTGAHAPVLTGLRTAIDVLADDERRGLFVLEHSSGPLLPPFTGPGALSRIDGAGSLTLANCLGRPTSMIRDERDGVFYITELVNGRVVIVH